MYTVSRNVVNKFSGSGAVSFGSDFWSLSVTGPMSLERHLVENCEPRVICSAFAALSGHTDRGLYSHYDMISNIRHQV
jgi:hypothetical protein